MARKPTAKRRGSSLAARSKDHEPIDDTAIRSLSKEERARLSMDSWEPSLLRNLLRAENKLRER